MSADVPLDFDTPDLDLTADIGIGEVHLDIGALDFDRGATRSENRYVKPRIAPSVSTYAVKYDRAVDLVADMGPAIMAGERVDALVSGNFIFGDFFEALAVEQNLLIEEMMLSTLSISQDNVDSLRNLIVGGYLEKLDIIVSDYFWSHNRHNAPYIYGQLDIDDRFQLAVAGIHTKIALLRVGHRKIIIHGSANFRSSRSVEVFTVETNPDLYDFHREWQSSILDAYGTVKKAVRASRLFDIITKGTEGKQPWHRP